MAVCREVQDLQFLIGILFGVAAGLFFASVWRDKKPPLQLPKPAAPSVAPAAANTTADAEETETLTQRLHSLDAVFAPLANAYAHPRELEEQREFAEAVRLLQEPGRATAR